MQGYSSLENIMELVGACVLSMIMFLIATKNFPSKTKTIVVSSLFNIMKRCHGKKKWKSDFGSPTLFK